ncbi:hypothetical protein JMX53_06985 [Cutibacterium avidum]|uniref:hypothetical protein n=1 Tax=Cutibacterium avidum TaxID=33010 RepID=UPI00083E6DA1|nr:hypothetical protein [Cutibacterium avidum]AOG28015.1 hypothetical protein BFS79_05180 [Cutibacterium avidum]QQY14114.1 hypothetical protein JMX53_06985 [Cutibacterium avidum]
MSHTPASTDVPALLRWPAWIAVGSVVVQAAIASFMLSGVHHLGQAHAGFGYLTLASGIVAAVAAVLWKRRGGPAGVMGHALGMAVLLVIQFALGEVGHPVKWVHVALGVVIVLGLVGLPMSLSRKK